MTRRLEIISVAFGQHSNWGTIIAGVPQGGVLGPLNFLIYINDIVNCVKDVKVRLFADVTCLFLEVNNRRETAEKVNNDLNRIEKWADKWLVTFSPQKTKSLIISNKRNASRNPPLRFKNENIEEVSSHKYLGLIFSKDLKWAKHVQ